MKKMVNNKKAISALIATVLLILITIAAVGIIWGAIMPIISQNIEASTKCFDAGLEIKQGGYTCYDSSVNQLQLQIGRGEKSVAIDDIQVSLSAAGTAKSFRIIRDNSTLISGSGVPGTNEETAYIINLTKRGLNSIDTASIAAVLKIGNTESLCPASQPVSINIC